MLIGPQSQLYQEIDRVLPAEIEYTHTLNRKIVINIPKGYKISNAKDCIINKSCDNDGKQLAYFKSSFEEAENTFTINCNEGYNVLFYPLSSYEAYKNVINAAADFNKIVLILEEK